MVDYEHYDRLAETTWGRYLTEVERKAILEAHQMCDTPTVALDVGASGGRWSELLSELGWKIISTEINPTSLDHCRIRVPQAACILANPNDTTLPCETESVGLILCIEVFAVMPTSWFTSEASRILKPCGLIVGVFNNKLSWRGYMKHIVSKMRNKFDYYSVPYYWWKKELRRAGFRTLFEEGLCWFPFSRSSNSRLVELFTRVEYWVGLRRLPLLSPWIVFVAQKK